MLGRPLRRLWSYATPDGEPQQPSETSLNAQTSSGFIFFGGTISAVNPSSDGTRVQFVVNALTAPMSVLIDENTTITGSLGGRASTSALTPNLFVEVEGWMGPDGTVRASNIQTKVQTGAIRMYGSSIQ